MLGNLAVRALLPGATTNTCEFRMAPVTISYGNGRWFPLETPTEWASSDLLDKAPNRYDYPTKICWCPVNSVLSVALRPVRRDIGFVA